jgi:hypothetical protein
MSKLTQKDLLWFRLANSNPTRDFYAFKDRFLKRYATPDGYDLQKVDQFCWGCDGSGMFAPRRPCWRCDGSGIHKTNEHWLQRYDLAGAIYHKPVTHAEVYHAHDFKYPEPKREFEGRIRHDEVDSKVARRAFLRLLVRHEPETFYRHVCDAIKARAYWFRVKLVWRLVRIRNKMDLFKAIPEDEVPF